MGLSFYDFCICTPDEFDAIYTAWRDMRDSDTQDAWERMRLLATITVQPHTKAKIKAHTLLPLPWDKKKKKSEAEDLTYEERKRRAEAALKKFE